MEQDKTEQDKTLSQKEIDALLSILPQDGTPLPGADRLIGSARSYDFRSPDKFSKEQIRTLQMIHENFARRVGSAVAAYLRTTVHLACVHLEQGSFVDFIQNIPTPSVVAVLKMDPLGRILIALDAMTATIAVDRLLGGAGRPIDDDHQITDIEQGLLQGLITYLANGLQDAWRNVIKLTVTTEEITQNPEFVQVALPTDAAIFLGFEIKIRETMSMMTLCIPYSVLKPIISELSPHTWVAGESTKTAGPYQKALAYHMQQTEVDLSVLLGEITVDFEELLHIQPGDVLVLNNNVRRPLPVLVGNAKKYLGQPGLAGSYLAVQITAVTEMMTNE